MMKKVVKFGALAFVVIVCSAHTGKGAVVNNAQAKIALAQEADSANCGCTARSIDWKDVPVQNNLPIVQASQLRSGNDVALGAATLESHGVSALAAELTETNQYNDHRCTG
jgi:hypothetical protein